MKPTCLIAMGVLAATVNFSPAESLATYQNDPQTLTKLNLHQYPKKGEKDHFLKLKQAPNSLALLPPPPQKGSVAFSADIQAYKDGLKLRNTARGKQAQWDADLSPQAVGTQFSEALGVKITPQTTPITYNMMYRLVADLGDSATDRAKQHYMRTRPFVYFKQTSCRPDQEAKLRLNGSYPSGHTAIGWGWALVLTELAPDRQDIILKRGYEFGQSRVICGAHWQSDVNAGRIVAAAAVAKLHTMPVFMHELNAAKIEINTARNKKTYTLH